MTAGQIQRGQGQRLFRALPYTVMAGRIGNQVKKGTN